jgi:hypothetical protein
MALKFRFGGHHWALKEGGPPMGSKERGDASLVDALKTAHPPLSKLSNREIASWIIARLNFITAGSLESEGTSFAGDTNEFGYKIKLSNDAGTTLAHGGVVFGAERVHFAALDIRIPDFQSELVRLLVDAPGDLAKCEIVVRQSETGRKRAYGWDGYSLIKW